MDGPLAKRLNRSSVNIFDFKRNYFICGQYCEVTLDPKNHGHWENNRGILRQVADRGKGNKSLKEVLLEIVVIFFIPKLCFLVRKRF